MGKFCVRTKKMISEESFPNFPFPVDKPRRMNSETTSYVYRVVQSKFNHTK